MLLRWRRKVERLAARADERQPRGDDCPDRLVVSFAGDHARLDADERAKLALAAALSGREVLYAMPTYIWSAAHAPGTMTVKPRGSRVRMSVVEHGDARLGRCLDYERNVVAHHRAVGKDPGAITAVGVMTDADDTQSAALAYCGDIALR